MYYRLKSIFRPLSTWIVIMIWWLILHGNTIIDSRFVNNAGKNNISGISMRTFNMFFSTSSASLPRLNITSATTTCTRHKCQSWVVQNRKKMFSPSVNPKELIINPCTVTYFNPLDQESEWGHPVGFLVPMLAVQLTTIFVLFDKNPIICVM